MTRQRKNEYLLEVEVQASLLVEKTGTVTVLEPLSCDTDAIKRTLIEDKRVTGRKKGSLSPIPGLYTDAQMPVQVYAEGNRVNPATGDAAVATALGKLFSGAAQNVTLTKGSVVGAAPAPTVSEWVEGTNDAHLVAAVDGSTTAIGLLGVEFAATAEVHVRPYTYTAGTETITTKFKLPAAPTAGDRCLGGQVFQHAEQWATGSLPYPLTVRALGNDSEQNGKLIGSVASITVPNTAVEEVALLDLVLRSAYGSTGFVDARPAGATPEVSPWAGGQVLLAPYGVDTLYQICAWPSHRLAQNWTRLRCPGNPAATYGIQDWVRGDPGDGCTIVVPHDLTPNLVGATATRWLDIVDADATVAADKRWHCMVQYGFVAGRILALYWPHLVLSSVSGGEMDATDARTLELVPAQDAAEPQWVALLT